MTECPCEECKAREIYSFKFATRLYGDDCPFQCDAYTKWREQQEKHRRDALQKKLSENLL